MPSTLTTTTTTTKTSTTTTTTSFVTGIISTMIPVTKTKAAEMKPCLAEKLVRELSLCCLTPEKEMDKVEKFHNHKVGPNQCCSVVVHRIDAPIDTVWGLVRRFDKPQTYKHFLRSCRVITGDGARVGCVREVHVVSGIPASSSTEKLEVLDEESYAIGFRVVSGEHRLQNYRSITTLHPSPYPTYRDSGKGDNIATAGGTDISPTRSCRGTIVVESYVVDVPPGNTKEETCVFVDTIISCNLQSLAKISERMARASLSSTTTTTTTTSSFSLSSYKVS